MPEWPRNNKDRIPSCRLRASVWSANQFVQECLRSRVLPTYPRSTRRMFPHPIRRLPGSRNEQSKNNISSFNKRKSDGDLFFGAYCLSNRCFLAEADLMVIFLREGSPISGCQGRQYAWSYMKTNKRKYFLRLPLKRNLLGIVGRIRIQFEGY